MTTNAGGSAGGKMRAKVDLRTIVAVIAVTSVGCATHESGADRVAATRWSLTPPCVIDAAQGGQLQRVVSVLWLPDGRLLLANAGARRLLLFDSLGKRLATIGRDGAGPGPQIRLYRVPGHEFYRVGIQTRNKERGMLTFVRYTASGAQDTLNRDRRPPAGQSSAMISTGT